MITKLLAGQSREHDLMQFPVRPLSSPGTGLTRASGTASGTASGMAAVDLDWRGEELAAANDHLAEQRLRRLLSHLPSRVEAVVHGLRRPRARWRRIPIAMVFLAGGTLGFLPVLGFWMLPLGLLLLAEDIPPLRSGLYAMVNRLADKKPRWFE